MRHIFVAALVAAAASSTTAAEAYGVVESVREVPLGKHPAGLAEVFEHAINRETAQELVVRLGDERAIVVVQDGPRRFEPGERVLVVRDGKNGLLSTTSN